MIFKSKGFWTAVLDGVISISLFAISAYTEPPTSDLLKIVVGAIQPIALALIAEFAIEKVNQNLIALRTSIYKLLDRTQVK